MNVAPVDKMKWTLHVRKALPTLPEHSCYDVSQSVKHQEHAKQAEIFRQGKWNNQLITAQNGRASDYCVAGCSPPPPPFSSSPAQTLAHDPCRRQRQRTSGT